MKSYFTLLIILLTQNIWSQELFVVTDPASNIPTNVISVNLMNSIFVENTTGINYHLMPEISYGIDKNLMVRSSFFLSNRNNHLYLEGGNIMGKYRFLSIDDIHSHFRMAAYGKYSMNRADIHQEQIEIVGHNSGFETGLIATKLKNKLAISSSISFEYATDNKPNYIFPKTMGNNAINYTLSFGRLIYPKNYNNFKQTNINLMLEFVGQTINLNKKSYLDAVSAIQFIVSSQARFDLAYRKEISSSMLRSAPNGIYINLYYTFL